MRALVVAGLLFVTAPLLAVAQEPEEAPQIESQEVAKGIYMISGQGGNLGVSIGEDATFLIDDQYAPLTPAIQEAIQELGGGDVDFVLNTHFHGDHTGGNENFGEAGALIVAHDNVRARLTSEQLVAFFDMRTPAMPKAGLPVVTFNDGVTFHINGETIHAFHVPNAHTDGDSIVHFRNADVFHMGDVLFAGMYPFIDVGSGGSIDGVIAALEKALEHSRAETRFIPGHGPLIGQAEVKGQVEMLRTVRDRVARLKSEGKSLEEVKAAEPTADLDETWGGGFIKGPDLVTFVYESLP
ncbi:MAG: MBL fold metallo-hydrolase [Thermoanaerobaculia bacterium]